MSGGERPAAARETGAAAARRADAGARAARFGETLRKAALSRSRAAATAADPGPAGAPPATTRRRAADGGDAALAERRGVFREDERASQRPEPEVRALAPEASPAAPAELRALVRALPVAVEPSRLREGAPLAISFGRSLDVELRPTPGGLELVLRPEARLARACRAELPGLVAALAARGLRVARAEVRARAAARLDAAGPRVDLPPGLR